MDEPVTLADWLRSEMRLRGFESGRQMAEFLGVGHVLVNQILNRPDAPPPSLPSLVSMADKTGANLFMLVALAYPEHRSELSRPPQRPVRVHQSGPARPHLSALDALGAHRTRPVQGHAR